MRIAVIGTGISGSLAARLLETRHAVTVFEAEPRPGGHAHTVDVSLEGETFAVDTGFMVFNRRTYPNFWRLLELLEVPSRDSDMSFSVSCAQTGLEYQGSSLNGLFAQRRNMVRPKFLRMLADIARFNREGNAAAAAGNFDSRETVGEFLERCRVGSWFVRQYLVPMAAAIWSSKPVAILDFPAAFMIGFFANHGLMQVRNRPQWRTIIGGSRKYVQTLLEPLQNCIRYACPVERVERTSNSVLVSSREHGTEIFDHVVFAAHSDDCLRMLADASDAEHDLLTAFPYQANECVLHTDERMLPRRRRAWASWNYHIPREQEQTASVTYDLSRLQGHQSPRPILLTLNATAEIDPARIIRQFTYRHPAFSLRSISAQQRINEISGQNQTHYCGAYWGYGFHEDGARSALAVAHHFGIGLEACTVACTKGESPIAATSL